METLKDPVVGSTNFRAEEARWKVEFAKYLLVGGLNAGFTFLLFVSALYLLKWHYLISLAFASGMGFVLTYALNYVWVFKPESRLRFQGRFVKYVLTNAVTLVANLVLLYYFVETTGVDPFYMQVILMGVIVVFNFSAAKFWSLKRTE